MWSRASAFLWPRPTNETFIFIYQSLSFRLEGSWLFLIYVYTLLFARFKRLLHSDFQSDWSFGSRSSQVGTSRAFLKFLRSGHLLWDRGTFAKIKTLWIDSVEVRWRYQWRVKRRTNFDETFLVFSPFHLQTLEFLILHNFERKVRVHRVPEPLWMRQLEKTSVEVCATSLNYKSKANLSSRA